MVRRCCQSIFVVGILLLASCRDHRAQRYPAAVKEAVSAKDKNAEEPLYRLSWIEPRDRRGTGDVPIRFVADTSAEWKGLEKYWNEPSAGLAVLPFAQSHWQTLTACAVAEHSLAVRIKVPRGLPEPTFPASNPPSLGKWRLGQALFHERSLPVASDVYSCASCHKPEQGFAEANRLSSRGKFNTLSLINVAYNRRQFWDGRVAALEETLVRSPEDAGRINDETSRTRALEQHNWVGFVKALVALKPYNAEFERVFGVEHPTQDTVAQALATYLRTILSGDSLFDRAEQVRHKKNAESLTAEHFREVLDDSATAFLLDDPAKKPGRAEMSEILARGHKLFKSKARCAQCHSGKLFTDQDFHNVGYDSREGAPDIGTETGRAVQVPVGLKESRLIGAFRTPTLRNLVKTAPYFHDGSLFTLMDVVSFYDEGILWTPRLADGLKDGDNPRRLHLSGEEKDALVVFLRALDGTPVDPIVTGLAKE
jgi:cytochrome c peroxidase